MITEDELKKLQSSIALIDAIENCRNALGMIQLLIVELSDIHIQIRMEPDNHKEPHIHIKCGKINHYASFSIGTGELLVEKSSKYDKIIKQWILEHRDDLKQLWEKAKAGENYEYILRTLRNDNKT